MVPPTFRPDLSTSVKAIKIIPHRPPHKPAWCRLSLTGIIYRVIRVCVTRTNISPHGWLLGLVSKWCLKQFLKNSWRQEQRVLPLLSVYPPFSWDQHREYSKSPLLWPSNHWACCSHKSVWALELIFSGSLIENEGPYTERSAPWHLLEYEYNLLLEINFLSFQRVQE